MFLLRRNLLLRRLDGLLLLVLWGVGALAGDLMAERGGQLLAVVGEELRIVRSARDGDIRHAIVEQVLRAQGSMPPSPSFCAARLVGAKPSTLYPSA